MRLHVFNIPLTPEGLGRGVEEANRFLDRYDVKNISAQLVEDKYRGAFWSVLVTYETKLFRSEFRESTTSETSKTSIQTASTLDPSKSPTNAPVLDKEGQELYEKLRTWRNTEARTQDVPGYSILTNRQLQKIAQVRPSSIEILKQDAEVADRTLEKYGETVLALVRGEDVSITPQPAEPESESAEPAVKHSDTPIEHPSSQT